MTTVGTVAIGIEADIGPLIRETNRAKSILGSFGKSLGRVGGGLEDMAAAAQNVGKKLAIVTGVLTLAGGAALALAKNAAATGDAIGDAAAAAGVSTGYFQEMAFAMGVAADMTQDEFAAAMTRLNKTLGEAQQGSAPAIKAFEAIGISAADIASGAVTTEAAFDAYIAKMGGITDAATGAAISVDLFGRAGAGMGGQLTGASAKVAELRARANELGLVMSEEFIEASGRFDERWRELTATMEKVKIKLAEELLPVFTDHLIPFLTDYAAPAVMGLAMAFNDLVGWISQTIPKITEFASETIATFSSWAERFRSSVGAAVEWVTGKFDAFIAKITDLIEKLKEIGRAVTEALSSSAFTGSAAISGDGSGFQGMAGAVDEFSGGMFAGPSGGADASQMLGAGVVNGMVLGAMEAMQGQEEVLRSLFMRVPEIAREVLQVNSPSLVFQEIGGYIGEGLANGISQSQQMVATAVGVLSGAATQSTSSMVSGVLSSLGTLFQGSKKFAAAQALVNAWAGASEALKLPFPSNLAAFGKVLATGLGAVRNISSATPGSAGGGGGAGSGGAAPAAPAAARAPLSVSLNLFGSGDFLRRSDISSLLGMLNKEAGDSGYRILVPAT